MLCSFDDAGQGASKKRQELIVVASLLDKAPNLAGLSRTCEVLPTRPHLLAMYRNTGSQTLQHRAFSGSMYAQV